MTKLFILALWYSTVYPGAYFMAALALFINYFTDRFGIMRTWKRAAHLTSEVSLPCRNYFFSLANMAMAFSCSYYWACFPFDNLCETGDSIGSETQMYIGTFSLDPNNPSDQVVSVSVSEGDSVYKYCSQDMLDSSFSFPFIPSQQEERGEWMTPTQENIATLFGWSALGVFSVGAVRIIAVFIRGCWKNRVGSFKVGPCSTAFCRSFDCMLRSDHRFFAARQLDHLKASTSARFHVSVPTFPR
jgi:hypothetical protein